MSKVDFSKLTTIVIVTYKGLIFRQTLKNLSKRFKIIIVENSDSKKFKEQIEKNYSNVKVILSGSNLGFAKANNIGLKKIKTFYSLVLNPDVIIKSDHIKEIENFAKKIKNFGILTCQCNQLINTIKFDGFEVKKNFTIDKRRLFNEIPYVPGWCMFFKTQDLKKLKYFDENFFLYYEDRDISKRMLELNKKLYVLNRVRIYHKFGGNSRSRNKEVFNKSWQIRFWHLYWSSFYYYRKHYGLLNSIRVHLSKFIRFKYLYVYYRLINNKNLSDLNNCRANGILSQLINKKAQPVPNILL